MDQGNTDHTLENVAESAELAPQIKLKYSQYPMKNGYRWRIDAVITYLGKSTKKIFLQPSSEPTHTTATQALSNAQVFATQNNLK